MSETIEELSERIIAAVGLENLKRVMPVDRDRIEKALLSGDEHLNSIPLEAWYRAAGARPEYPARSTVQDFYLTWYGPWEAVRGMHLSLADRVIALKHVARVYVARKEVIGEKGKV